jgi:hypothetical protein
MSEEQEKYLEHFSAAIEQYRKMMYEAFEGVLNEGVSLYPVFVFHQQEVTVGIPIVNRELIAGDWSVNISTLEEFYIKGLVKMDQVEEIKQRINGMPQQYCCLVLAKASGGFVFLNREED